MEPLCTSLRSLASPRLLVVISAAALSSGWHTGQPIPCILLPMSSALPVSIELCFVRPLFDLCFVRPLFDLCFFRSEFRSIYAPNDRTALIGVWQALLAFSGSAGSISGARPTSILESRVHFRFWRKFCPNRQIWRLSNRQISPDLAI